MKLLFGVFGIVSSFLLSAFVLSAKSFPHTLPIVGQSLGTKKTDWQKIEHKEFALKLPESFTTEGEQIAAQKQAIGNANLAFVAIDKNTGNSTITTSVTIAIVKVSRNAMLPDFVQKLVAQFPQKIQVTAQKLLPIGNYPGAEIVTEWQSQPEKLKQVIYLIPQSNKMYVVTFTTDQKEFTARYTDFQSSVASLSLHKLK